MAALNRHGFVRVAGENGIEVVCLTPKGLAVRDAYEERIKAVEAGWRNVFRDKRVTALRRALEDVAKMARCALGRLRRTPVRADIGGAERFAVAPVD